MTSGRWAGREIRPLVLRLLRSREFPENLGQLKGMPVQSVLSPILASLFSPDEGVKWRAVTAVGILVAELAEEDLESARDIVRRLMWSLNEASGGIGWGAPEAMGEILARHPLLAREFAPILISYIREDGNPLENEALQRGVMWGLSRLAEARPHLLKSLNAVPHLLRLLGSEDATVRGLGARTLGLLASQESLEQLRALLDDASEVRLYHGRGFVTGSVQELARGALEHIDAGSIKRGEADHHQ